MGDPKKLRKKYRTPSHPWQKLRIEEEKVLMREYGFKNKSEIWKIDSMLKDFKTQVKLLVPKTDEASERQKQQLIAKVQKLNLLPENAVLEDILGLTLKDMCERRLQTIVTKKGLARSVSQARQFIVHDHIMIGDKKITSPNYVVRSDEELMIKFAGNSPYKDENHSERVPGSQIVQEEKQKAGLTKEEVKEILPEEPVVEEKPKEEEKSAQEELKEEVEKEKAEVEKNE
jgi:small subunit ribosomal protein S4